MLEIQDKTSYKRPALSQLRTNGKSQKERNFINCTISSNPRI